MVVLVHIVRPFLGFDVLSGVVLVVGIDVPTLDAGGDVARFREVVLALEVAVLDEVPAHLSVLHAPLGLEGEVGDAHGVHGHAVAVDEDALVGCHGVAVGVVESVGVVERSAVGRVGDALIAVVGGCAVEQSQRLASDVTVEASLVGRHGIGIERAAAGRRLGLHLDCVAVVSRLESLESHFRIATAGIGRVGGDVLHGKGRASAFQRDIRAHVATAEDELALLQVSGRCQRDSHFCWIGASLNDGGCHREAGRSRQLDVLFKSLGLNKNGGRLSSAIEGHNVGDSRGGTSGRCTIGCGKPHRNGITGMSRPRRTPQAASTHHQDE